MLVTQVAFDDGIPILVEQNTAVSTDEAVVSLFIFGHISVWWGVNADQVYNALRGRRVDRIRVYINSMGGSLREAYPIYDFLNGHSAALEIYGFGEVMSAALLLLCAGNREGDTVVVSRQTVGMAHNVRMCACGTKEELRAAADMEEIYDTIGHNIVARKTGMSVEQARDLMTGQDYFMSPDQMVELGFADQLVDSVSVDFQIEEPAESRLVAIGTDLWNEYKGQLDGQGDNEKSYLSAMELVNTAGASPYQCAINIHQSDDLTQDCNCKTNISSMDLKTTWQRMTRGKFKVVDQSGNAITEEDFNKEIGAALQEATKFDPQQFLNAIENDSDFKGKLEAALTTGAINAVTNAGKLAREEAVKATKGEIEQLNSKITALTSELKEIQQNGNNPNPENNSGSPLESSKGNKPSQSGELKDPNGARWMANMVAQESATPEQFKAAVGMDYKEYKEKYGQRA